MPLSLQTKAEVAEHPQNGELLRSARNLSLSGMLDDSPIATAVEASTLDARFH